MKSWEPLSGDDYESALEVGTASPDGGSVRRVRQIYRGAFLALPVVFLSVLGIILVVGSGGFIKVRPAGIISKSEVEKQRCVLRPGEVLGCKKYGFARCGLDCSLQEGAGYHTMSTQTAELCAQTCEKEENCRAAQWVQGNCSLQDWSQLEKFVPYIGWWNNSAACIKTGNITQEWSSFLGSDVLSGWKTRLQTLSSSAKGMMQRLLNPYPQTPKYPIKRILYVSLPECTAKASHMESMLQTAAPNIPVERIPGVRLSKGLENTPKDIQPYIDQKGIVPCDLVGNAVHISNYHPFRTRLLPAVVEWSIYFAHVRAIAHVADLFNKGKLGKNDAILIVEDDTVLDLNWLTIYEGSSNNLHGDWEVMKLYWMMPFPTAFSMAAYVVRAGAASNIIRKLMAASPIHSGGVWSVAERNIDTALPMDHVKIALATKSCVRTVEVPCRGTTVK